MKYRHIGIAAIASTLCLTVSGCRTDSPSLTSQPAGGGLGGIPANSHCSDPSVDYVSSLFAAVICIKKQSEVPQPDGSRELKLDLSVKDIDPNNFTFRLMDLNLIDAAGNPTQADYATGSGTGTADCVLQEQSFDAGWLVKVNETFTPPGPICFRVDQGSHPTRLVWQDDIAVSLP